MTIDEAIKHAEEVAEEHESELKVYENLGKDRELFKREENSCKECGEQHRQLVEWLKELKQLREQTRWIPVSDGLPEDRENVLFSTKAGIVFEGKFFDDKTNFQWYEYRYKQFEPNSDVTAWTPLPKPYKEGEKE